MHGFKGRNFLSNIAKVTDLRQILRLFLVNVGKGLNDWCKIDHRRRVVLIKLVNILWSSGPNTRRDEVSITALSRDAEAFLVYSEPSREALGKIYASLFTERDLVPGTLYPQVEPEQARVCGDVIYAIANCDDRPDTTSYIIGALGRIYEPARKVRVFAQLDSIRQRLLYPLHEWAMTALRLIPQDGTYDQLAPLRRIKPYEKEFFCYDLSSRLIDSRYLLSLYC